MWSLEESVRGLEIRVEDELSSYVRELREEISSDIVDKGKMVDKRLFPKLNKWVKQDIKIG